jgi:UDP-N-acetyl-D-glucosamine dehydrogenase
VTYKANIADQRESPAQPLARALVGLGAKVVYHDPYVTEWTGAGVDVLRADDLDAAVAEADLVILVQNHAAYDVDRLAGLAKRFFDTRGATSHPGAYRL